MRLKSDQLQLLGWNHFIITLTLFTNERKSHLEIHCVWRDIYYTAYSNISHNRIIIRLRDISRVTIIAIFEIRKRPIAQADSPNMLSNIRWYFRRYVGIFHANPMENIDYRYL